MFTEGREVATGTKAGLLDGPQPQSLYKHGILDQYVVRYATMTASKLSPRRAVLFDGFGGRGRFDTGQPASGEYMMLAAQKVKASTQIDLFLVERSKGDFAVLDGVADEYRQRGLRIETRNGECAAYLDEAIRWSNGASLFLFLDPCGAILPFDTLSPLLRRRGPWPRTEALLNFNADLIRRAGGQYKKHQLDLGGVARADTVCGGEWWREVALRAHIESGEQNWESAAEAVATEYAKRLTAGTRFGWIVAPAHRRLHHQPVYYLIFLTTDEHGFWVFGAAAAKAREAWLRAIGPGEDELEEMLFNSVDEQIAQDHNRAIEVIKDNLRTLLADGTPKAVVRYPQQVFGSVYGEAKETAYTAAVRQMVGTGEIEYATKGSKPYQHVLQLRSR